MVASINEKGITKSEMISLLTEQFDMVFRLIDSSAESVKTELKNEIKAEISDLRNEMGERFGVVDQKLSVIDKRLAVLEENSVYRHEFKSLTKRVEKLETAKV